MSESDDLLASLLEGNLDDVADMPEFKAFPEGAHICFLHLSTKTVGEGDKKKIGFDFGLTYSEVVELTDATGVPPAVGDKCNQFCDMNNEMGAGTYKMLVKPIATYFGIDTSAPGARREILDKAQNLEVQVITGF